MCAFGSFLDKKKKSMKTSVSVCEGVCTEYSNLCVLLA